MNKIPDRWLQYTPIGKVIENTRFIAFKVPLKQSILHNVPEEKDFFSLDCLFKKVQEQDKSLGLVIDLTNTDRYYDKDDVVAKGCGYTKVYTKGHEVPSMSVIKSFFAAVEDFLEKEKEGKSLIGVHCTHGVNRTGYLICRYLRDKMDMKADEAIEAFRKARGHPIERCNYLHSLKHLTASDDTADLNSDRSGGKVPSACKSWRRTAHPYSSMPPSFGHRERIKSDYERNNHRINAHDSGYANNIGGGFASLRRASDLLMGPHNSSNSNYERGRLFGFYNEPISAPHNYPHANFNSNLPDINHYHRDGYKYNDNQFDTRNFNDFKPSFNHFNPSYNHFNPSFNHFNHFNSGNFSYTHNSNENRANYRHDDLADVDNRQYFDALNKPPS